MNFSPTDSKIYATLFTNPQVAEIFSDQQSVRYMLDVEAALAKSQANLGIIPTVAATQIVNATHRLEPDYAQLQAGTERAGLPIIELVRQLREAVQQVDDIAPSYVHWGATTQDIMDTALVLQMRAALQVIEGGLVQVIQQLATLADNHRNTLMAGRTHSQQALPITFGLKVAGWLAPLLRHRQRLTEIKPRLLVVQFGGAAGTLASLGEDGLAVQQGLAQELSLAVPLIAWHGQRDNLVEMAGWLSLVSGSLAKMALDIILMAQTEVGELRESADPSRGGSSTMPQKSNPVISEVIIAAARTNATHLAAMHSALIHEHERATHSWQMEWLNFAQMFALTSAALDKAAFLSENLVVNVARMEQNVRASNGLMLGERISFALSQFMNRTAAKQLVKDAVQVTLAEDRHLVEVVQEMCDADIDWTELKDEAAYLGATQDFIQQILNQVQ